MTQGLLVTGPDSSLRGAHAIAGQAFPGRQIQMVAVPCSDYYHFDWSCLSGFSPAYWQVCGVVNEFYVNDVRRSFLDALHREGYETVSLLSPTCQIDSSAVIGNNTIIHAGASIGPGCIVGDGVVIRANVVLTEDITIGDYVTLEANVAIRESSSIGAFSTVCANASLARMTKVGRHCYLNLQRRYEGVIPDKTFFSPMFQNPVRIVGGRSPIQL